MAGVKTLADGNVRAVLLAAAPVDIDAITVTEATAVGSKYLSDNILFQDFDLGPTGSETIDEKSLEARGNAQVFGFSQYGGGLTVFRYLDPSTGKPDETDDWAWDALKTKGTLVHLLVREDGQPATTAITTGDEYRYYAAITDDPVRGDRTGFIKWRINLAVQNAALDKVIAAGS